MPKSDIQWSDQKKLTMPTAGTTKIRWKKGKKLGMPDFKKPVQDEVKQEEPMGLINGRSPGSKNEWYIAQALWKLGWTFSYQVPIHGGSAMAGGQILDFIVNTIPMRTVLEVDGGYWHQSPKKEEMDDSNLVQALRQSGDKVRGEVLHAYDADHSTPEDAYQYIYKNFGRA